ncbi:GNAT family N-acetyltransferase [Actinopolymorpha sp. B17G11]|uniref:GNAT family N-acetyltransferase n=1 Tax=unclassified Actinopolymorpha TaxID=2627063 RepID=UPI0032D92775
MPETQLHMVWPAGRVLAEDALGLPEGYALEPAGSDHLPAFRELMAKVALGQWNDENLARVRATVVPSGWQVVRHQATGALVATGMAQLNPIADLYPEGHEVGWIAAHPDHGGRGLGRVITAAAVARLLDVGATEIYLRTDDYRLPAIKAYLRLGFVPHLWADGMVERWRTVCDRLDWPFEPPTWPGGDQRH